MKAWSKRDKLKSCIAPKMTYLITFLDNNRKYAVYTGVNIHELYRYLEIIGSPTIFSTSGQQYRHFGPSYYINSDTETFQSVISALRIIQKSICECCGIIGHKADD